MACLAAQRFAVLSRHAHSLGELAFVRVLVATGASQILPVILLRRLGFKTLGGFVAIGARNCHVPACQ